MWRLHKISSKATIKKGYVLQVRTLYLFLRTVASACIYVSTFVVQSNK